MILEYVIRYKSSIKRDLAELPKTTLIALTTMFVILEIVSSLALLADIGKVMKGMDQ